MLFPLAPYQPRECHLGTQELKMTHMDKNRVPRDLYASVGKQRSTQYKMNAQWAPLGSHCSSFFDSLGHLEFGRAFSVSGGVLRNGFQNPGAEKKKIRNGF